MRHNEVPSTGQQGVSVLFGTNKYLHKIYSTRFPRTRHASPLRPKTNPPRIRVSHGWKVDKQCVARAGRKKKISLKLKFATQNPPPAQTFRKNKNPAEAKTSQLTKQKLTEAGMGMRTKNDAARQKSRFISKIMKMPKVAHNLNFERPDPGTRLSLFAFAWLLRQMRRF